MVKGIMHSSYSPLMLSLTSTRTGTQPDYPNDQLVEVGINNVTARIRWRYVAAFTSAFHWGHGPGGAASRR